MRLIHANLKQHKYIFHHRRRYPIQLHINMVMSNSFLLKSKGSNSVTALLFMAYRCARTRSILCAGSYQREWYKYFNFRCSIQ